MVIERLIRMFWALAQISKDIRKNRQRWKEEYAEGFKIGWKEGRKELIRELIERNVQLPPEYLKEVEYRPNEPSRN